MRLVRYHLSNLDAHLALRKMRWPDRCIRLGSLTPRRYRDELRLALAVSKGAGTSGPGADFTWRGLDAARERRLGWPCGAMEVRVREHLRVVQGSRRRRDDQSSACQWPNPRCGGFIGERRSGGCDLCRGGEAAVPHL